MNRTLKIIDALFKEVPKNQRCPYLERDNVGPYCNAGRKTGSEVSETRRMVCCTASLQLWCLAGEERYVKCTAYTGEERLD